MKNTLLYPQESGTGAVIPQNVLDFIRTSAFERVTIVCAENFHATAFPLLRTRDLAVVSLFTPHGLPDKGDANLFLEKIEEAARQLAADNHGVVAMIPAHYRELALTRGTGSTAAAA